MILIDTGPIVAIHDHEDFHHENCAQQLAEFRNEVAVTTWACFTEAVYLLGQGGGYRFQARIRQSWKGGLLELIDLTPDETQLSNLLMGRYQDHPMDLADATLVAIADLRGWRKVFTLDSHFFAYRLRDGSALEVILPTS